MNNFGKTLAAIALVILSVSVGAAVFAYDIFFGGYVVHKLWGWFVVCTFGVREMPVIVAAGVMMIVSYMTHQTTYEPKDLTYKQRTAVLIGYLAKPVYLLFLGWVLHRFFM